jgi:thiol-disulfide isomerase/thioredoxin
MKRALVLLSFVIACGAPPKPAETPREAPKYRIAFRAERLDAPGEMIVVPSGKAMLLAFIATWSSPDKKSLPKLQTIHEKYRARGLVVVDIDIDDEDRDGMVLRFAQESGAKFAVVWDKDHVIASQIKMDSEPMYFILDGEGVVRFVHRGYHDGEADQMDAEIAGILR